MTLARSLHALTHSRTHSLTQIPAGADPTKKESCLSDADFEKLLGSPRAEFEQMKPWKQQQLKKAAGLF